MAYILVIDDDEQLRRLFKGILHSEGHEVAEAGEGTEGIRLYRERRPDLVITDLIMPGKEGIETILELRQLDPTVKIIAVSGGGRIGPENYLATAHTLGAAETLTKPLGIEDLLSAVRRQL